MKKRIWALLLTFVFAGGVIVGASELVSEIKAELRKDFTIKVDGIKQDFKNSDGADVYPILFEGTTYLPVRAIGELMGKIVYWDEDKKEIDLRDGGEVTAPTVTDADVIIESTKKDKPEKLPKADKKKEKENPVDTSEFIGEEKAKAIALEKAGLEEASNVRVKPDYDNGIWEYEVEIRNGRNEYDADINAKTGEIIKWEVDFD